MICGIGTDIVELHRIARLDHRHGTKFRQRILSPSEHQTWETFHSHRKIEFLAGRFAAKEAIAKALGIGIGRLGMSGLTIQLTNEGLSVIGETLSNLGMEKRDRLHISISHSHSNALAIAIWERL